MMVLMLAVVVVLALVGTAAAQAAPPIVNPSQLQWTAPTTNADGTALKDLGSYRVRVAGPQPVPFTACPAYTQIGYPVGATVTAAGPAPVAGTPVTVGIAGSKAFAALLGISVDGVYCTAATAVDLGGNESVGSAVTPFERNVLAPAAPSGLQFLP